MPTTTQLIPDSLAWWSKNRENLAFAIQSGRKDVGNWGNDSKRLATEHGNQRTCAGQPPPSAVRIIATDRPLCFNLLAFTATLVWDASEDRSARPRGLGVRRWSPGRAKGFVEDWPPTDDTLGVRGCPAAKEGC